MNGVFMFTEYQYSSYHLTQQPLFSQLHNAIKTNDGSEGLQVREASLRPEGCLFNPPDQKDKSGWGERPHHHHRGALEQGYLRSDCG